MRKSNENYAQPSLPAEAHADVVNGLYRLATDRAEGADDTAIETTARRVHLLGSGAILREVIAAAELLAQAWGVEATVWSATSFSELAREAGEAQRWNRLHPLDEARRSHVELCLGDGAPVVAATDSVRAWPELIATHVKAPFTALGTDGFGRSETRAALRRFFEVDRHQIVLAALTALCERGEVDAATCTQAIERYGIDVDHDSPWRR